MRAFLVVALLGVCLGFAPSSQAHYGDIWFNTAYNTASNIVDKYPFIVDARCSASTART